MADTRPLISICIPVLNEADNVERAVDRVRAAFAAIPDYRYEIVFTDNHSTDGTFAKLQQIAADDPSIRVARFATNVGYQRSILTGYMLARGDAVVQLDCDMQDPPELIGKMLECWRQGADVVYGVRKKRKEGRIITGVRRLFYRMLDAISDADLPHDAGDFRLVDRKVVEVMRHIDDKSPYLRGMITLIGFNQVAFDYERDERTAGETKFNMRSLVKLAVDAIVSHSSVPLQLASYIGFMLAGLAIVIAGIYLIAKLAIGADWPSGFATLSILILANMALTSLLLGIIGIYLSRLITQSRDTPISVIAESINLESSDTRSPRIINLSPSRENKTLEGS